MLCQILNSSQWYSFMQVGVLDVPSSTPNAIQEISEERKKITFSMFYRNFFSTKEISEQRAVPLLTTDVHHTQALEEVPIGFEYITLPD